MPRKTKGRRKRTKTFRKYRRRGGGTDDSSERELEMMASATVLDGSEREIELMAPSTIPNETIRAAIQSFADNPNAVISIIQRPIVTGNINVVRVNPQLGELGEMLGLGELRLELNGGRWVIHESNGFNMVENPDHNSETSFYVRSMGHNERPYDNNR